MKPIPVMTRFERNYIPVTESGCWLWLGLTKPGKSLEYGLLHAYGRNWPAHRLAWTLYRGPIPEGFQVCHHCDVSLCVNPDHLFIGTNTDNVRDCIQKNRRSYDLSGLFARHAALLARPHCLHGHPWTEENTYYEPSGKRACRACMRRKAQKRAGKQ